MKQENRIRKRLEAYERFLRREEKSPATCEKYLRDVQGFLFYLEEDRRNEGIGLKERMRRKLRDRIREEDVQNYKQHLTESGYSPSTINAKLTAIRCFLGFEGVTDIRVRNLRIQHKPFLSEKKLLTKDEYEKLVTVAAETGQEKLSLMIETLCATGMRVSELSYMTVEAAEAGEIRISLKGKIREILISGKLRRKLSAYAAREGITSGPIFLNGKGEALHRSQIWQMMKALAETAGVDASRVFPHNLRRLFARSFYTVRKDIAKLADVLGHSSIDTTRIYIATTADEHLQILEELKLVT